MEEKNMTLLLLGAIALPAIIGMIMMFKGDTTGAGFVSHYEYPAIGKYGAYSNVNQFPYYRSTYGGVTATEIPGYQQRTPYQQDWAWRREPANTYGAKRGRCAILATPEIGQVPPEYTWDANYQQSRGRECVQDNDALMGWCCIPPKSP